MTQKYTQKKIQPNWFNMQDCRFSNFNERLTAAL